MGQTISMDLNIRRDMGIPLSCLSRLAWVPIPVLLTALGFFWAADWQRSHPSIHLLLIVNIVFTLLACLVVAYLITRSFLIRSAPGLLLLGCGVGLWGPAGVVATVAAHGDANISITIYNSCLWLSVLCHLAGVTLSLRSRRPLSPPTLWWVGGYACAAGAVALVTLLALAGWIPAFYVEERGATFARQVVLASAIGMCALAALLLVITRRRPLSGFAYWYALALLLIATGLLGVMLQTHHASVLGWTGRMTQALGALYLFVAAVACVRESRVWGMSLETALQESEGRYRTLFEMAPDAIIVHRDGRFLAANDALLRLAGAGSFQELAARPILDFFRPGEREQAAERVRLALAGKRQPIRESTLRRLDGQEVAAELHTGPIDFQGAPAVQTIIRDVTDRRRAGELLKIKESAIASSLSAIAIADLQGRVTYVNPACVKLWGYEEEREILGRPVLDFWKEPQRAMEVLRAIGTGSGWVGELVAVRKDGTCLNLCLSASAVRNEAGDPICMMASFLDVTERKRSEQSVAEAKRAVERERDILQAVMNGAGNSHLAYLDRDFHFVRVNETYARACGYRPEEMIGKNHFALYPHAENEAIFARVRDTGEPFEAHDKPFEYPDQPARGMTYWNWTLIPIKNPAGHVEGLVFSLYETTERKKVEEALKQSLRDTQQRWAEVSALMTCTRAVLECRDLVSTTRTVFNACRERLGAPAGYVAILSRDGENNDVLFLEAGGLRCTVDPSLPMPVRGLRGEVYRTGRVVYENHFAHGHWAELLPPGHVRLENVLFAPVVIDGRTVGLLGLGNKPGGFTDQDATLAATFGELVAIALRNSRTLDSLRELNATLESKVGQRTAELAQRARQLQKLTLELSQAEERERRRIAVLLHEDLQQHIAGAKFHLNLLRNGAGDEARRELVPKVDEMLREAIEKSRSLSHDLSPAVLHLNDLGEVLDWLTVRVQAQHGLTVHADICGDISLPSEALTVFLFRAAQEVLSNVVKHAGVKEATLRVRRMGRHVCLCISDTGRGFDPQRLKDAAGFGLLAIRERVELLGGRMKIRSFKDRGTAVRIVVPEAPETAR